MTRKEGIGVIKRFRRNYIKIENPLVKSHAALILLNRKLFSMDKSIYSPSRMQRIRNKWMKKQLENNKDSKGGLTCSKCNRKGLDPFTRNKNKLAVLDHKIEINSNGPWNDPNNFQILCYRCNCLKQINYQKNLTKNV